MSKPPIMMRLGAWVMKPKYGQPIDWHETVRDFTLMEGGKVSMSQAQVGEVFKLVIKWLWIELRTRPRQLVWFVWSHR